jgi:hypothetical protein
MTEHVASALFVYTEQTAGSITIGSDGKVRRPLFIKTLRDGRPEFVVKVY